MYAIPFANPETPAVERQIYPQTLARHPRLIQHTRLLPHTQASKQTSNNKNKHTPDPLGASPY